MYHKVKWLPGPVLAMVSSGKVYGRWFYLDIHYRTIHLALGIVGGRPFARRFWRPMLHGL